MSLEKILVAGEWVESRASMTFSAVNPKTGETLPGVFPVSGRADLERALEAAAYTFVQFSSLSAGEVRAKSDMLATKSEVLMSQSGELGRFERLAVFLETYAKLLEARGEALVAAAHAETGLPVSPRLKDVELPRMTGQLRQAAVAARERSWTRPTIDTKANLRSMLVPLGPVVVIGPNNFPFAFNGVAGGDFAAAIAAGCPVIAKGHPLHPMTTKLLAEAAREALVAAGLPMGMVQMVYHLSAEDGEWMVQDKRVAAVAFTGSRAGGMALKAAAEKAGKLFFGEMSSINPVVILPGAVKEKGEEIAGQYVTSVLMGTGQFCTNPGVAVMMAGPETEAFIGKVAEKMKGAPVGTLFSKGGREHLLTGIRKLKEAGAEVVTGGNAGSGTGYCVENTLMRASGATFCKSAGLQTEAFGNASLVVVAESVEEMKSVLEGLEGNLTGTVYSATDGADDGAYGEIVPVLRKKVGRLINDKMPTGVAVSAGMNHGGPYPATSAPQFTAVGFPWSALRFTALESYDGVRASRLPVELKDKNPDGKLWRWVDGVFTQGDVG